MNAIKFSEPWDKLKNIDGFTTIRRSTPEKAKYYHAAVNNEFQVMLNGEIIGHAVLKSVDATYGCFIPENTLADDVSMNGHMNEAWYKKIRGMDKVLLLYFERVY